MIATTGEKEKLIQKLEQLSEHMPVFFSANMSYGIHALTKILEAAVPLLQDYDIELTEAHHKKWMRQVAHSSNFMMLLKNYVKM